MFQVTGGIEALSVTFTPITSTTDIAGYVIHAVHADDVVGGDFTPTFANRVNVGPETSFTYAVPKPGLWYAKVAAYDTFEDWDAFTLEDSDIYTRLNYSEVKSATTASAILDLTDLLQTLNPDVTSQMAEDYLNHEQTLLGTLDTRDIIFAGGVADPRLGGNYTEHVYQNSRDYLIIAGRVGIMADQIELLANNAAGSPDYAVIDLLTDMIGMKIHSDGGHTAGMVISWADAAHTKSNITFRTDAFLVEREDGHTLVSGASIVKDHRYAIISRGTLDFTAIGSWSNDAGTGFIATENATLGAGDEVKEIFSIFGIGKVNGVDTVGIWGDLIVDGSIKASSLEANIFVGLDFILGDGQPDHWGKLETFNFSGKDTGVQIQDGDVPTVTIKGGTLSSSTITGGLIRTATSGTRVEMGNAHLIELYDGDSVNPSVWFSSADSILGTINVNTDFVGIRANSKLVAGWFSAEDNGAGILGTTDGGQGVKGTSQGGTAVMGQAQSGTGVHGSSTSGLGGYFAGNATFGPINLQESLTLPTDVTKGNICFYKNWLCFSNGTSWYTSAGVLATTL